MLLAFFPFLIFLMSLLGAIDVDKSAILEGLFFVLPGDIADLVYGFIRFYVNFVAEYHLCYLLIGNEVNALIWEYYPTT